MRRTHNNSGLAARRRVYVVPNLITAASLFSGMCAIIFAADGFFVRACYLILLSAVLDALDGPIARLTRTASPFGLQFDSLSDVIAFGVAPAYLMFRKLSLIEESVALHQYAAQMAIGVSGLYAVCGAVRLARYNIQAGKEEKITFTGLPIPAAAGTLVSTFLVIEHYLEDSRSLHRMILILMIILAYLMVSTYPFPSIKSLTRRTKRSFNNFITLVFAIFTLVIFREHLALVSFIVFMSYLGLTIMMGYRRRRRWGAFSPGATISLDAGGVETDEVEDDERDTNDST